MQCHFSQLFVKSINSAVSFGQTCVSYFMSNKNEQDHASLFKNKYLHSLRRNKNNITKLMFLKCKRSLREKKGKLMFSKWRSFMQQSFHHAVLSLAVYLFKYFEYNIVT